MENTLSRRGERTAAEEPKERSRCIPFGECRLECDGWAADARYGILVDAVQNNGVLYCEDYGARVELAPEHGPTEIFEQRGITPFRNVAEEFVNRLRLGGVTPATAGDVLEDYLAGL